MTVSKPETVEVTQADIARLRKAASAIYIAVEAPVADDISKMLLTAASEIETHRLNATPSRQDDLREALERISKLTPFSANAASAEDFAATVHAIADTALSDTPPPDNEETEALRAFVKRVALDPKWTLAAGDALSAFNNGGK